ncbi:MAG TPA: hypothetical protein VN328_13430 [Thermodesulfovibrionales bacterium]|nr:hypothetical protein [Thermodesulfovibrionales bacterium]
MEKRSFLAAVAEVMKGIISHDVMMASLERCGLRPAAENKKLLRNKEARLDKLIAGIACADKISVSDNDLVDALVLRYLNNMQFLSGIKEDSIDISELSDEFSFWKKTMLFKTPKGYDPKKSTKKLAARH